jgi:hypothetical protein
MPHTMRDLFESKVLFEDFENIQGTPLWPLCLSFCLLTHSTLVALCCLHRYQSHSHSSFRRIIFISNPRKWSTGICQHIRKKKILVSLFNWIRRLALSELVTLIHSHRVSTMKREMIRYRMGTNYFERRARRGAIRRWFMNTCEVTFQEPNGSSSFTSVSSSSSLSSGEQIEARKSSGFVATNFPSLVSLRPTREEKDSDRVCSGEEILCCSFFQTKKSPFEMV